MRVTAQMLLDLAEMPEEALRAVLRFLSQQLADAEVRRGKDAERKRQNRGARLPEHEWLPLRARVFARDGLVCAYCGTEDGPFECDHVVPVSRGGGHDLSNLAVACKPCNSSKGGRLLSEWRQ